MSCFVNQIKNFPSWADEMTQLVKASLEKKDLSLIL